MPNLALSIGQAACHRPNCSNCPSPGKRLITNNIDATDATEGGVLPTILGSPYPYR